MTIRESQFRVFNYQLQANAEQELDEHCQKFAPLLFDAAGETGVREAVRLGLKRAQGYGFKDQPQIRFYIDMMLVLGSEYDTDPQFPWAAETLQDRFSRAEVRGMVLHRDLSLYIDRVMGQRNEYLTEALDRFLSLPAKAPPPHQRTAAHLRDWLRRLFPQKSDDVNDEQLAQISAVATEHANRLGLPGRDGILAGVMLVFGHRATEDPLYPWISGVLRDPLTSSSEGRLERLYARLHVYAERARKHLASGHEYG